MIQAGCPNCQKINFFEDAENGFYKCNSCGKKFKKCSKKNCNNMISWGFFCNMCIANTLKSGGALVLTGLIIVGGKVVKIVVKSLIKKI